MKTYIGKETKKGQANFPFPGTKFSAVLISAFAEIKEAAALAHIDCQELDAKKGQAIAMAAKEMREGKFLGDFTLPALQGGAGTSLHMNVNEVLANRAEEILKAPVHPNDDVNLGQSTNDVCPSALKIYAYRAGLEVCAELQSLALSFKTLANKYGKIRRLARTHLQDAVPTSYKATFLAYFSIINRASKRIRLFLPALLELNLGGTAIGNSVNASQKFQSRLYLELRRISGLKVKPMSNLAAGTQSGSDFLVLSALLTAGLADIYKISNDLRILASGPLGGLGEISFTELQSGSSIMPGKVNPVMMEALGQLYSHVSGNHLAIEHAVAGANLELSHLWPVIADRLTQSLSLTSSVISKVRESSLDTLIVNQHRAEEWLNASTAYATCLTPILGYETVAQIVKQAILEKKSFKDLLIEKKLMTTEAFESYIKKQSHQ